MTRIALFVPSAMALAVALASAPAHAQQAGDATATPEPPKAAGLEDIVVTARRVTENIQDVPVSITAFSGQQLVNQGARTTADIQTLTPNLSIRAGGPNVSTLVLAIRGQVQNDVAGTVDPSIGVYVDEVYLSRPTGIDSGLLDLERVEVLKGPQGTLFGRNSTGGALNISTNKPDTHNLGGSARVTIGNFGERDGEAVLNVPLVLDKLAIRLAGQVLHTNGYGRDLVSGTRLNETNNYTIRGKLRWTPTDRWDITLSGEHFHLSQYGPTQKPDYVSPNTALPGSTPAFPLVIPSTPEIIAALSTGGCFDFSAFSCPGSYRPGSATFASSINTGGFYDTSLNFINKAKADTTTTSINAAYELSDNAKIKYIGAYRYVSYENPTDLDGTPFAILHVNIPRKGHSWSHELQLAGKLDDRRLDYTVGVYRFTESGSDRSTSIAVPLLNPNNPQDVFGLYNTKSSAVYGQLNYRVTDALSATGGLRYSVDEKGLDSRTTIGGACVVPAALRNNPSVPCSAVFNRTDKSLNYTASINFKPANDILLYAKTSSGFRSGGFNLRANSAATFANITFKPEKVTDYEIGAKTEFLDRHVRLNVAAFTSDYRDIQRTRTIPSAGTVTAVVDNAARGRIKGLEAELTVVPTAGLTLSGGLGITDAGYKSFPAQCVFPGGPAAGTPCDRSGEPFDSVPKTTWNVSGQYVTPVGEGEALFRLDYSHTSSVTTSGLTYTLTPNLVQYVTQTGYGLLNGRISWSSQRGGEGVTVAAFARNIAKKKYNVYFLDFVNAGLGYDLRQPGEPRRFGAEVSYKF